MNGKQAKMVRRGINRYAAKIVDDSLAQRVLKQKRIIRNWQIAFCILWTVSIIGYVIILSL